MLLITWEALLDLYVPSQVKPLLLALNRDAVLILDVLVTVIGEARVLYIGHRQTNRLVIVNGDYRCRGYTICIGLNRLRT